MLQSGMAFDSCTIQLLILSLRRRSTVGATSEFETLIRTQIFVIKYSYSLQLLAVGVSSDLHCAGLAFSHLWNPEEPLAFWKTISRKILSWLNLLDVEDVLYLRVIDHF